MFEVQSMLRLVSVSGELICVCRKGCGNSDGYRKIKGGCLCIVVGVVKTASWYREFQSISQRPVWYELLVWFGIGLERSNF